MASNKCVLLVDDDITSLDIISFLFEDRGYKVLRQADGRKAIDMAQELKPDVLVVDLLMPGLDGVQTVNRIRGLGLKMPIIAFTAVDDPDLHEKATEAGCNAVLTKPCRPEKLMQIIEKLLSENSE